MSDIRYLFRFRDLVAHTIEEHRKVIVDRDWCWWGWWKRPFEDSRRDVWDDLKRNTKEQKPVAVGLFDSGFGKVYRAEVADVIPPSDDAEEMVDVPPSEAKHIPEYYQSSLFSRAWLEITKIEQDPIDFFGSYSFAEVPQVANYAEPTLRSRTRR